MHRLRHVSPRTVIIFLAGVCAALILGQLLSLLGGADHKEGVDRAVVVSTQQVPESENVKALRKAPVLEPDPKNPQDDVVGHWQRFSQGGVIEKVGDGKYRWLIGEGTFMVTAQDGGYQVTPDEENMYFFELKGHTELRLVKSHNSLNKAVRNPAFEENFSAVRIGIDGRPASRTRINDEVFDIVGKTYGQLAGRYGPGSLTVISGQQFVIFRGEGGNFAVSFAGDTVPLSAGSHIESLMPRPLPLLEGDAGASYPLLRLSQNDAHPADPATEGGKKPDNSQPPASNGDAGNTKPHTPQTPSGQNQNTDASASENDEEKHVLEVPNPATFPSTKAVATGVVWADLGFFVKNCPEEISLAHLSDILGLKFETGQNSGNSSGYSFYGASEGYFASNYTHNNKNYKISGYGKDALSRAGTIIFVESR